MFGSEFELDLELDLVFVSDFELDLENFFWNIREMRKCCYYVDNF